MREPLIVVGFGKYDLKDLMGQKDTEEGQDRLINGISLYGWPPRYRRASICTPEEITVFQEYLKWVLTKISKKED